MSTSKVMKWITGLMEAVLGIPFLGGLIVISFSWVPLIIMLILHIVTLVISANENTGKAGSVVGIITSCIAWIPFVGMVMHLITALLLLLDAAKKEPYGRTY